MNLDSLSFALAEISYSVANLTKKNFRSSVAEINHVRHLQNFIYLFRKKHDKVVLLNQLFPLSSMVLNQITIK